jgi:hypothetical protein
VPFDSGVGFAFTGKDAGLSKAAKSAAVSIDGVGSSIDGLGQKFQANLDNVQGFFKELSQKQLDRVESGLQSIADASSINQTSLEGMAASAAKVARPIVASLGLTGDAAKKAKGQIVGLSIGMNVGAETVGKAVKALTLYGEEFRAVGLSSTKDIVKFGEASGVEMDKFGSQIADLGRSWGLSKEQLADLVPWIVEAGRSFGFGKEAVASLGDVTKALDENLSKVLLKNGPEAISKFTKGIYGLALVSSKSLGMDFPDALGQSIEVFNKLAGDVGTFQNTFTGLGTEFGPLASKLGLAIGDWDVAFKLVQNDPLEFVKQLRVLMDNMDQSDQSSQFFLNRLKLTLGEDSSMVRFLTDKTVDMDKAMGQLEGVKAGTKSMQDYGNAWGGSGRTMAEQLDMMREAQKMRFMAISKDEWKPYMKNLRAGYTSTVDWMKHLASDTEPGGVGTLIKAASMGLRFGPGGAIRMLFPSGEGDKAAGMIDSLSDSLVDFLPHITALGALGFRPAMLAAPFKMAFGPLAALGGPLTAFSGMLGGLPKMALSVFGPLGILAIAIGSFTILSNKWKKGEESAIEKFFKTELPIMLLRGLNYLLTGKDLEKGERKALSKLAGPELWGNVAEEGMAAFGKALSFGMEAFEIGTDVMVTLATKLADGISKGLANADYEKFGESLAKIVVNLTSAIGKVVAKTPDLVVGLAKGIASALGKIEWGKMFGGAEKEIAGASAGMGETIKAGFGLENVLGAGALIGLPLVLGGIKKIRKDSGSMLGALSKKATKAPAGVLAGIPECVPTCGMEGAGGGGRALPGPISGPGAVMQPQAGKWAAMKAGMGKAAGWKGVTGMGAAAGALPGLAMGGVAAAGGEVGLGTGLAGYGGALALGGMKALPVTAALTAAGGAVKGFREQWSIAMTDIEGETATTSDYIEASFKGAMGGMVEAADTMTMGITKSLRNATAKWLGLNEITGEQIGKVFEWLWEKITGGVAWAFAYITDAYKNIGKGAYDAVSGVAQMATGLGKVVGTFMGQKVQEFMEYGKLISMRGTFFFKKIWWDIQSIIDKSVIGSMEMFKNVIGGFYTLLDKIPESAKKTLRQFEGFKTFEDFVVSVGKTIDKEIDKKLADAAEKSIERQKEQSAMQGQIIQQEGALAKLKVDNAQKLGEAWDKTAPKIQESVQLSISGMEKMGKGVVGATLASAAALTPAGALFTLFAPESWKQAVSKGLDQEMALSLSKDQEKNLDKIESQIIGMQNDMSKVTEANVQGLVEVSQKGAVATLQSFSDMAAELGIKKGKMPKLQKDAATILSEMSKAESPEAAAAMMKDAVAGYKGAEKGAMLQMLSAAGGALFAQGALGGMVGKTKGEMAKEGLAFTEALAQAQMEGLSEIVPKGKKAKAVKEAQMKAAEATATAAQSVSAAVAEASSMKVGGKTFAPPPPPAAKIGGLGVVASAGGMAGKGAGTNVIVNVPDKLYLKGRISDTGDAVLLGAYG